MMELVLVLLVLACPLAMFLMMRGGHGHGGHRYRHSHQGEHDDNGALSTGELRARRDDLDRLIAAREDQPDRQEAGPRT